MLNYRINYKYYLNWKKMIYLAICPYICFNNDQTAAFMQNLNIRKFTENIYKI